MVERCPHKRIPNAAQALAFLENRFSSCFPDRLAILANYEYRINTKVLKLPITSFSICSLTLALLNGDMSLLGVYEERLFYKDDRFPWYENLAENRRSLGKFYRNDNHDLQSNTYGFSWCPKPSACLENITYLEEHGAMFRL